MNLIVLIVAGLFILAAVGLVSWVLLGMVKVERELRAFSGSEGLHFEI